jgi:multidrug efflux pump
MAFFGGSTGVIYRQFSITIVSAMVLSVLVALILTPALCATMLKPIEKGDHGEHKRASSAGSTAASSGRRKAMSAGSPAFKRRAPFLLIYLAIVVVMGFLFTRIPTSFLPEEDQGVLYAQVQTPAGSSAERTQAVLTRCATTC